MIKAILLAGEASGLLPASCLQNELNLGTLRAQRLVNPEIRGHLALFSLPSALLNPAKQAVRDLIADIVRSSTAWPINGASLDDVTPILRVVPSKVLPLPVKHRATN